MSKRKHDDVHSASCGASGSETFVLGSPGSECLSGTCECHGKDTVTSASRLSASSPTCLTCASNGPFSTSQLRNGNANPRCISCIGGIFDTPTQRRKSSSALPDKDRIAKLCQPTPLLDIDLPLDDFIARAQAFAAEVTDTYGEHLAEPDLPHLFNGWNTFTPEEFFALDAIAGSSLAADRATPKSVRIALEGPDADNWSKALATELSGMKKHKAWTVIRKGSDNFPTAASSISSQMVFKVKADKIGVSGELSAAPSRPAKQGGSSIHLAASRSSPQRWTTQRRCFSPPYIANHSKRAIAGKRHNALSSSLTGPSRSRRPSTGNWV